MNILPKLGRGLVISSLALTGGAIAVSNMPTKIHAAKPDSTTNTQPSKLSRKNIEDEDGAIFLSSLSVLNQSSKTSQKWDINWDKRNPDDLVKPLKDNSTESDIEKRAEDVKNAHPKAKRTIILVRHGQYNIKADQDSERYLTDLGKEQADITGKRISELVKHLKTKTTKDENGNPTPLTVNFVKSTMTRATQTANIILEHFPEVTEHQSCDLIREGAPCPPDPPFPEWDPSPADFFIEGSRIEAAFRKYIHRASADQENDSVDVLVCHGNVIRYFVCRGLQFPAEAWLRFGVHNGSITVMTINKKGDVILTALGESGHLPVDKLTFN